MERFGPELNGRIQLDMSEKVKASQSFLEDIASKHRHHSRNYLKSWMKGILGEEHSLWDCLKPNRAELLQGAANGFNINRIMPSSRVWRVLGKRDREQWSGNTEQGKPIKTPELKQELCWLYPQGSFWQDDSKVGQDPPSHGGTSWTASALSSMTIVSLLSYIYLRTVPNGQCEQPANSGNC